MLRPLTLTLRVAVAATAALALASCGSDAEGDSGSDTTVKVAYTQGFMPYIGEEDGALTGAEGDMLNAALDEIGDTAAPEGMDFDAFLAGIQAGRYDIGIGGVSWKADRAAAGIMTDPVYYSPVVALSAPGTTLTDIDSMIGVKIGALAGSTNEKALREIDGVELTSYPTSAAAIADLEAGRIQSLVIDPLLNAYTKQTRPDLSDFTLDTITPPTEADVEKFPGLAEGGLRPYQVVWYCSKQAEDLCNSLDDVIDGWYEDGTSADILAEYGITDTASFFQATETASTERQGADRADDWAAPTAG
jgi:L-cystine transport system substrate-binding protein